jgi:hypothetical protein
VLVDLPEEIVADLGHPGLDRRLGRGGDEPWLPGDPALEDDPLRVGVAVLD